MKRFGILFIALLGLAGCQDDDRYVCISDGPLSERGCLRSIKANGLLPLHGPRPTAATNF